MKIDFSYNAQDDKTNEVQYFDTDGKMVAKYPYEMFLIWMDKSFDFEIGSKEETDYIDANWIKLTTDFYNEMQPSDYPIGKQGIYNIQPANK